MTLVSTISSLSLSIGTAADLLELAFLSPSQVKACFQSVPFQDNVRQNIMSSVAAMYSLDIFQYNQLHDDDPSLNQGVDIDAECEWAPLLVIIDPTNTAVG